jgi:hypothetical protein
MGNPSSVPGRMTNSLDHCLEMVSWFTNWPIRPTTRHILEDRSQCFVTGRSNVPLKE